MRVRWPATVFASIPATTPIGWSAPAAEPTESPLHHPPPWQQDEAGGAGDAPDDDQRQAEQEAGEQDGDAVVDAVGEHRLQPRVEPLQSPQQVTGAVGVLDVGGMNPDAEQQT